MSQRKVSHRVFGALGIAVILAAILPLSALGAEPKWKGDGISPPFHRSSDRNAPIHKLDRSLLGASGRVEAVIRLAINPVGTVKGVAAQRARGAKIAAQQKAVLGKLRSIDAGAKLLGTTKMGMNALLVKASAKTLAQLARDARVVSINGVRDYKLDDPKTNLDETVPYIGGSALHDLDLTGEGVVVAVLDTGVDYTHIAFGGPGNEAAYRAAYGNHVNSGKNRKTNDRYRGDLLYPTDKVIGGWDFVGEQWPNGPLKSDPDPIDCSPAVIGCDGGHGTHVADIIAGEKGVAPGADILAYKVCSSVSSSCSGIAMILGIEASIDPNNDGLFTDHADVINMSIGSTYGQSTDDSISYMTDVATAVGILVVASAGNSGDKPYVTGTPAAAPTALSVAQTAVPSSTGFAMLLSIDGGPFQPREAVHQSWSHELDFTATNQPIQFGNGAGGNTLGCDPFPAGSLTGKILLVDRGDCNFSLKIANIAGGGGLIGVIGLVTPGDPFDGALGDCPGDLCHDIPGYMVSQSTATQMKDPDTRVTFDPSNEIDLVGHMVGSSSRGPDNDLNLIKPEIGAPGASVSAEVGTGDGTTSFGGTSGAAPMVAGSAALLMQAYPGRSPLEIKAVLINSGETEILNRPAEFGGQLAPITRIGGGEVRVDDAWATNVAAWDDDAPSAALSFGFHDVTDDISLEREVRVRNYGNSAVTYEIAPTFRFANDESNGAVTVTPSVASLNVPANSDATFDLTLDIDASALRTWTLDSGINGASAAILQTLEYDGYVWLDASGDANDIHLPWQVLPRRSSAVSADSTEIDAGDTVELSNDGAGRSWISHFALVATSADDPGTGDADDAADVDLRYVGVRNLDGNDLGCDSPVALQFAVNTWERQVHANAPALFEFDLDLDQDGTFDYAVYNFDLSNSSSLADGRNFTWALNLSDGTSTGFWPTVHATNSGNTVLTVCGEQIGLDDAGAIGQEIDVLALAADWYNSGAVTDFAEFTIVAGHDRYATDFAFGGFGTFINGGSSTDVTITDTGAAGTTPDETGVLLLTDESLFGILAAGASGGASQVNEAIAIEVTP